MKNNFFKKDNLEEEFKPLSPKYYPEKYKIYIEEERNLIKKILEEGNAKNVLEAGVGIGRLIPDIARLVGEFYGIDNSDYMIKKSQIIAEKFDNVRIKKMNIEEVSQKFPRNFFDYSLCVWNTLGNVESEVDALKSLREVTKNSVIVTTYLKGTIEDRKEWYKSVDVEIDKIDAENEIFYSKSGLKSKSYSQEDIQKIAEMSGFKDVDFKILGEVILWSELKT